MTGRQRFQAAMAHQPSDRVPFDLAATSLTGMSAGCQRRLLALLGFSGEGPRANHGIDERLLEWAGTDFRSVGAIAHLPGPLEQRLADDEFVDNWGVRRKLLGGHWQIVGYPLAGADRADLAAFPWPEPVLADDWLAACRAEAQRLAADGRYGIIGEHPVFGVLELGCWMCGYDDFLARLAGDRDFVRDFFDRVFALQMAVVEPYYQAIGEYLDLTMSGDDFGMQGGPLVSPAMFRELVAPYFAERIRRTKALMPGWFWHHSCGSVVALLDELIACGVDMLNPIQTSAVGMDPAALKARYGDRLVFWGAADVQDFLRTATPEHVRAGVRELIAVLGRDGGYVLAPAHNLQDDVPAENIAALVEASR